ncbi:MAG: ATP-binding protein, partial [Cyanobacteria bacterium P01_D01_bin.6]
LRTPLNAIIGFAQILLRDHRLATDQQDNLKILNRSGEHLLALINDVLEMSKIEAGRVTLNVQPIDLYHLLDSLEEMLQVRAQARGLQLIFNCSSEVPQYVHLDEGKLRQVLINLLGNGVKFTSVGSVSLRVRVLSPLPSNAPPNTPLQLTFEVADTGQGIPESELDSIFDAFIQSRSIDHTKGGTGLGLAISQQFVRLLGGDLKVTSMIDQGTRFTFQIPTTLAADDVINPSRDYCQVLRIAQGQPTWRILVVDDNPDNRLVLHTLLKRVGFEVMEAVNGQEAIAQWQTWHPHLIWMDMRMPVMDGYETTQRIRELEKQAVGNREQGTGNREQGIGNREQGTGNREQGIGNREQGIGNGLMTSPTPSPNAPATQPPSHPATQPPTPRIPIIALTASVFEEKRAAVLAAGCDEFVRKPFREQVIFEKLAAYLGVQYEYQAVKVDRANADSEPAELLTPDALQFMSVEWIQQLHKAAVQADATLLHQQIQQIPEQYNQLSQRLTYYVQQYDYDRIIELSATVLAKS